MNAAQQEHDDLQHRVEELRAFEREYRSRLRAYHADRIAELDGDTGGTGLRRVEVTRQWSALPGTSLRVRLRTFATSGDGPVAWIEVDDR